MKYELRIPGLYLAFADPMSTPGLMLSPSMTPGFKFIIMDVNCTEGDRVIELQRLRRSTASLRCCAIPSEMWSNPSGPARTGDQAVAVSTSRLHNIACKYTGEDDPVMLLRV